MTFSENILGHLVLICERDRCNLFEAMTTFCEEKDLDVEEIVDQLDAGAKAQLKAAAIDGRHVRRCIAKPKNKLPL